MLVAATVSFIITSGCIGSLDKNVDMTLTPEATNNPSIQQEETTGVDETVNATKLSDEKLFEPVVLPGPGFASQRDEAIPKYDSETEEKMINKAKDEILRVFPKVDVSSLDKYHWDTELAGSFFVPVIVFEGVVTDVNEPRNICEVIAYDPEKERIVLWYYTPDSPVSILNTEEIIQHEDVDIERDIVPVFKKMIGNEKYEENKDKYFIYLIDYVNSPLTTCAVIYESCNDVKSDMGYTEIYLSRSNGEIITYGERFNNEKFFEESIELSPTPEISLEEAKKILEAKIEELYPDDPQEMKYCEFYKGTAAEGYTNGLFWLDSVSFLDTEDGYLLSPIPLAWRITFSTKESRNEGGPFDGAKSAYIDANSGEILYLRNSQIDIIP